MKKNGKKIHVLLFSLMMLVFCMMPVVSMAKDEVTGCTHHINHSSDCGGEKDEGWCTYVCEECVKEAQTLIDALPAMYEINKDNSEAVGQQLDDIDDAMEGLSDAAKGRLEAQKYEDAAFVLSAPPNVCSFAITKAYVAASSDDVMPTPEFAFLDSNDEPALMVFDAGGASVAHSVAVEPMTGYERFYLPAGEYTLSEEVEGHWNLSMSINGVEDDDLTFTCEAGLAYKIDTGNTESKPINVIFTAKDSENEEVKEEVSKLNGSYGYDSFSDALTYAQETLNGQEGVLSGANITISGRAGEEIATVTLTERDTSLLANTTLTINSGVRLEFSEGSSLKISEEASIIMEEGAAIVVPDNYFWRDDTGKLIKIEDSADKIEGPATLSYGIDFTKDGAVMKLCHDAVTYNGTEQKPMVTVEMSGSVKVPEDYYEIIYDGNFTNATTSGPETTVRINGKEGHTGTLTKIFKIEPKLLHHRDIKIDIEDPEGTLSVTVTDVINGGNKTLEKDKDYTVKSEKTKAGTLKVSITGIGNYAGTYQETFEITTNTNPEEPPADTEEPPTGSGTTNTQDPSAGATTTPQSGANAEATFTFDPAKTALALNKGLKVSQKGKQIQVKYGKVSGADGYEVFVQTCNKKFKKKAAKTVKNGKTLSVKVKKVNGKKLKLKNNYKVYVAAYKMVNGKKVQLGKSIEAHVVGSKNAKYSNVKKIKLSKKKYSLKKGKTAKIKAKTVLVQKKKKDLTKAHAKKFRYASTDKKVATVTKAGKIKAVGKGKCKIYVYARNGYAQVITVTVK